MGGIRLPRARVGRGRPERGAGRPGPVTGGLPQESCLGQISANGVLLFGETPAERTTLLGYENAGQWQENQLACKSGLG